MLTHVCTRYMPTAIPNRNLFNQNLFGLALSIHVNQYSFFITDHLQYGLFNYLFQATHLRKIKWQLPYQRRKTKPYFKSFTFVFMIARVQMKILKSCVQETMLDTLPKYFYNLHYIYFKPDIVYLTHSDTVLMQINKNNQL